MKIKDVIAQAEKETREEIKNALFDYMVDYNKTLGSDDRDILIEKTTDRLFSKYYSYTKDLLQSVVELSDKIESQHEHTEFDEWRAFKGFRNSVRDIITNLKQ